MEERRREVRGEEMIGWLVGWIYDVPDSCQCLALALIAPPTTFYIEKPTNTNIST